MPIKDILLPLVGEPSAAAIAAIDKCMAVARIRPACEGYHRLDGADPVRAGKMLP